MPGAIVVSGATAPEAAAVIADTCAAQGASLVRADEDVEVDVVMRDGETTMRLRTPFRAYGPVRLALRGDHQVRNAVVAVRLLEALEFAGVGGGATAITTGLADASWPGRLERRTLANGVAAVLDGAHNPAGAEALARWLRDARFEPVTLVAACMRDKDVAGLLSPLLPLASRVVATAVDFPRALPATDLAATIRGLAPGMPVELAPSPAAAMAAASEHRARTVVAGSLFLVGAVREWLDTPPGRHDPA
jgi:dihydrofolate synthase/folylpolyglutamate synthase